MRIGTLYCLDFEGVEDTALLNDPSQLSVCLQEMVKASGLEAIGEPLLHQFKPYGVTCLILLAQSHLAVSTWPEHRMMAVDLFTCGDPILGRRATEQLKRLIACHRVVENVVERYSRK